MVKSVAVRPASSIVLIREAPELEVLMVERVHRGFFGGLMVFPGGAVDECDHGGAVNRAVRGGAVDHPWRAAGLRELAEETGIALVTVGVVLAPEARGELLYDALIEQRLLLDATQLSFISRWITPEGAPSRFDTKFYLAVTEGNPQLRIDHNELEAGIWVRPSEALHNHETGSWRMFMPTLAHLSWLAGHETAAAAVADAERSTRIEPAQSRVMEDGSIVPIGLPGTDS